MENTPYDPSRLMDFMLAHLGLNTDARLAERLGIPPPTLCKIRKRTIPLGAAVLVRLHEESGMSVAALRQIMGDRRSRFRGAYTIYSEDERAVQRLVQAFRHRGIQEALPPTVPGAAADAAACRF